MELENKLIELEFLSGQLTTMNQFADLYDSMLNDCKARGDTTTAKAMQGILMAQVSFLLNGFLKEKQATKPIYINGYGYGALN